MEHQDHVNLLRGGVPGPGGVWADLGAGAGAFTLALADLIGPGGVIYSVDKDQRALRQQEQAMRARFPAIKIVLRADAGFGYWDVLGFCEAQKLDYVLGSPRISTSDTHPMLS